MLSVTPFCGVVRAVQSKNSCAFLLLATNTNWSLSRKGSCLYFILIWRLSSSKVKSSKRDRLFLIPPPMLKALPFVFSIFSEALKYKLTTSDACNTSRTCLPFPEIVKSSFAVPFLFPKPFE